MSQPYTPPGEHVGPRHFGGNNPLVDGVRWAAYPRGFALNGNGLNSLFDGAPPLNPFTNQPYLGAIIGQPRVSDTTFITGCQVNIDVGDSGGGRAFRNCIVGPGSPIALALGQYSSVRIMQTARSAALGNPMNAPLRIQWVDTLPALPDAGLLRSPMIPALVAAAETNVPDGAVEMFVDTACQVTWNDYSGGGGAAITQQAVAAGASVRCQGQTFSVNVNGPSVRFFLAGL